MKIYLAGPMRGIPEFNFPAFAAASAKLRAAGHEVFNPAEKGAESELIETPDLSEQLAFRRKVFGLDTAWICAHADAIYLLPGWQRSSGAQAERALGITLGLPIVELEHVA
jgi:hypothetical protein